MRRTGIVATLCAAALAWSAEEPDPGPVAAQAAVDALHRELAGRFSDPHGLLYDYTGADGAVSIPTAEELRLAKPNGLAWWSPVENGAFFTGLWLAALVERWEAEHDPAVRERARTAAAGLLRLASVGVHPAFIARGLAADGRAHPPAGSDDQTLPWFYGLWRYLGSGMPEPAERAAIAAAMLRVGTGLRDDGWLAPCDPPELGPRGGFASISPITCPRLLFIVRALHEVSGDAAWLELYRRLRDEHVPAAGPSRLAVCADGDLVSEHAAPQWGFYSLWTKGHTAACLAMLAGREEDPTAAAAYRRGLDRLIAFAAGRTRTAAWDATALPAFEPDWRRLLPLWREQRTVAEIAAVASAQATAWDAMSPRKSYELLGMAEPLFACWIITLGGEAQTRASAAAIRAALCRYAWTDLRYSTCFAGELAWWTGRRWLR